jgi:predicted O-methyltransferase YrrM
MKQILRTVVSPAMWLAASRLRQRVSHDGCEMVEWMKHRGQWAALRESADATDQFAPIYALAQREFGLCQVRSEIEALVSFVSVHNPRVAGEIGTRDGGNTFLFMHALSHVERYVGMDLAVRNRQKLLASRRRGQRAQLFSGNSQTTEMRDRVRQYLEGDLFDFLFIDGDHRYEGVKADFLNYRSLVRPGGLIAFHDIVKGQATSEEMGGGNVWAGGVPRFWQELKPSYEHREFVENREQTGFGIGVMVYQPTSNR